jgi:hypothetical protein
MNVPSWSDPPGVFTHVPTSPCADPVFETAATSVGPAIGLEGDEPPSEIDGGVGRDAGGAFGDPGSVPGVSSGTPLGARGNVPGVDSGGRAAVGDGVEPRGVDLGGGFGPCSALRTPGITPIAQNRWPALVAAT